MTEAERRNGEAQRRFDRMVKEHPSFADPIWGRARQRYFLMRDRQEAGHGPDGHWESTPEHEHELAVLGFLEHLITQAQKKFGRRSERLETVLRLLPKSIHGQAPGVDRTSRMLERLALGNAQRNRTMTWEQILAWYKREKQKKGISSERSAELEEHVQILSVPLEPPKAPSRALSELEDMPSHSNARDARDLDSEFIVPDDKGEKSDIFHSDPGTTPASSHVPPATVETYEGNPQGLGIIAEQLPIIQKSFQDRVDVARRRAAEHDVNETRENRQEILEMLHQVEEDVLESLALMTGHSVESLRGPLSPEVIAAMDTLQSEDSQSDVADEIPQLIIVKARIEALNAWFAAHPEHKPLVATPEEDFSDIPTHHGRMANVLPERASVREQTPEEWLGVAFDATAEDVEHAFAKVMQGLDYENNADRSHIVAIQGARERLLQRAEQRERDAERLRNLHEALHPASDAPREPISEAPEGWWSKQLRTPGAKIRALFAGVAGLGAVAGAGAIALHELGENDSDPSHIVAGALENPTIDDGSSESFGVDREGDKDTEGAGPAIATHAEAPNTDHIVAPRETLWKVLSEKIHDRGLRPTHEKIMTLKHYADLENPGVDWDTLQIGQTIHLASVDSMLDAMEGKMPPTLQHPAYGAPSSVEHQPHDVSQSIAQQHAESAPSWIAGSTGPGYESVPAKAYEDIPREGNTQHVMAKGEWIYKILHHMLRENGLNWSTPRITRLKNMTLQENGLSEDQAKKIPVGAIVSFDSAMREIQAMKAAKEKEKKK